jgi:hypothetical protein
MREIVRFKEQLKQGRSLLSPMCCRNGLGVSQNPGKGTTGNPGSSEDMVGCDM